MGSGILVVSSGWTWTSKSTSPRILNVMISTDATPVLWGIRILMYDKPSCQSFLVGDHEPLFRVVGAVFVLDDAVVLMFSIFGSLSMRLGCSQETKNKKCVICAIYR